MSESGPEYGIDYVEFGASRRGPTAFNGSIARPRTGPVYGLECLEIPRRHCQA